MTHDPNPYASPQSDLWPAGQSQPSSAIYGDAPIATFRSQLTAPWFERAYTCWAIAFQRAVKPQLSTFIFGGLMAFIVYWYAAEARLGMLRELLLALIAGAIAAAIALLSGVLSHWSNRSIASKQFRASKDFGEVYTFAFYREGFVSSGPIVVTARRWSGFASSRRFSDGILIMLDGNQFHWLSWTDLVSGKMEDVESVLRANIADYKEVRG